MFIVCQFTGPLVLWFRHFEGQLTLESVVGISDSYKLLCISSLSARMKKIQSKMKALKWLRFSHCNYGDFSRFLLVMIRKRFSLRQTIIEDITFGLVRMYVTPYRFSWTIFILGLALSYTDKLLVFRLVQIVLIL